MIVSKSLKSIIGEVLTGIGDFVDRFLGLMMTIEDVSLIESDCNGLLLYIWASGSCTLSTRTVNGQNDVVLVLNKANEIQQ